MRDVKDIIKELIHEYANIIKIPTESFTYMGRQIHDALCRNMAQAYLYEWMETQARIKVQSSADKLDTHDALGPKLNDDKFLKDCKKSLIEGVKAEKNTTLSDKDLGDLVREIQAVSPEQMQEAHKKNEPDRIERTTRDNAPGLRK